MNWNDINDELPSDNTIVYAMLGNVEALCRYKNDSFGLGDADFKVKKWRYAVPSLPAKDLRSRYYSSRSTSRIEDRKGVGFLESLPHLGM